MRKTTIPIVTLLAAALLTFSFAAEAQQRYRWTDGDGNRQISDRIPADAARYRIEVLNNRGMVMRVIEPQILTDEQREEAERQAEATEQARLAGEAQARHDRMLLQSYTSVRDLELARDNRLQGLAAQIRVSQSAGDNLQQNVDELQAQVDRLEANDRPVPDALAARLERAREQLAANQRFVAARLQEYEELEGNFAVDLERYKALRGIED